MRKSSPMKPSGVQLARAILPPGLRDPKQLGGRLRVVGGEHGAEHGRDGVEGAVRERERLRVPFQQLDRQALGVRAAAAVLEECRDVVDPHGRAAVPRRGDRGVAAAGRDVEHTPAGLEVGGVAEVLGHEHDPRGDDGEVAARPGCLLPLLDRLEVGSGGVGDGHFKPPLVSSIRLVAGLNRRYGGEVRPSSGRLPIFGRVPTYPRHGGRDLARAVDSLHELRVEVRRDRDRLPAHRRARAPHLRRALDADRTRRRDGDLLRRHPASSPGARIRRPRRRAPASSASSVLTRSERAVIGRTVRWSEPDPSTP